MDKKYRLYIDETGTAAYKEQESERYLTLTGVIMKDTEIIRLKILLDDFKYTYIPNYDTDSGELFNLHRTDMVNCKGCFSFLKNESLRTQFDDALLSLLNNMDFTIISATFDKIAISRKYGIFRKHPYTYLLDILFTRYIYFLDNENARGDILIESRNKTDDNELKNLYRDFYHNGNHYISSRRVQSRFTSSELKLKRKEKNIGGLQIADLVSKQTQLTTLKHYGIPLNYPLHDFGIKLEQIIYPKIRKHPNGKLKGYGLLLIDD